MSFPIMPNITPLISVTTAQVAPLLLASIALEELSLAHIMNAEAEKLQLALGTLTGSRVAFSPATVSLTNLLDLDRSVQRTLRDVIKKEMLLEFKFENVLDLISTLPALPATARVTLTADPTDIGTADCPPPAPTSSTLSGQVLVNGSPASAGTPVFFTLSDSSLGTITPNPAFTDASGVFTAAFNASSSPGGVEMISANALGQNSNTVSITVRECAILPGLTIAKTAPVDVVLTGNSIQYNITVINTGTEPLTNLTVTDLLPPGTVFAGGLSLPAGWIASTPPLGNPGTVTFTDTNPFAPESSVTLQFNVTATTPGTMMNTASASANEIPLGVTSNETVTTVI